MCIYGYSLTAFLPVTALCFIKSTLIQTALLFAAFVLSTAFLIKGILGYSWRNADWATTWGRRRRAC